MFYRDAVRGRPAGRFLAPYLPSNRFRLHQYDDAQLGFLDISDALYAQSAGLPDRDLVAILDSGVAADHPLIRPRIAATQDFTGEGFDDASGHGTMRCLMTLLSQPSARFVIAKVVGSRGGRSESLIAAIDWAIDRGAGVMYLALGVYDLLCFTRCKVCQAAKTAVESHRVVVASPGNKRWRTACPAKAPGVTTTVATPLHLLRKVSSLRKRASLSTIPAYFAYPGESGVVVAEDVLDLLGTSGDRFGIATGLEALRAEFRRRTRVTGESTDDLMQRVASFVNNAVDGPLATRLVALDEIWARLPEGILAKMRDAGFHLVDLMHQSMWVPLHPAGIPRDFSLYATVPREVPRSARYLLTAWEYTWANIARLLGRGLSFQAFHDKAASALETYISSNPGDADANFQLGVLHLLSGYNRKKCADPLSRAERARPSWRVLSAALRQARDEGLM